MKKIFNKATSALALGAVSLALFGVAVAQKAVAYVQGGLSDSATIRVSEKTTCDVSEKGSSAKFSGCNSIL